MKPQRTVVLTWKLMFKERLSDFSDKYRREINAELSKLTESWYSVSQLEDAVQHSLWGGKRTRPLLALMAAHTIDPSADLSRFVPIACAVELVHIFTLVHDDLPSMDNAFLRHGHDCTHVKFGEGVAVLAGDALLNQAFGVVLSSPPFDLPDSRRLAIIGHICHACATVVAGQVIDLSYEGKGVSYDELENLHRSKTAALLSASCMVGGELAGAAPEDLARLNEYATYLGLAYQVKDDLLSFEGDEVKVGKTLSTDEAARKATYPRIVGKRESVSLLTRFTEKAIAALSAYGEEARLLVELALWGKDRTS